jgi:hypothetical protein
MSKELIAFIGVLLGGLVALFVAIYNNSQETKRKDRERLIQKIEELHQVLVETYLRTFIRHHEALQMIKQRCLPVEVDKYLRSSGFNDNFALMSKTRTLSALYAPEIVGNSTEKLEIFFLAFDEFATKHESGIIDDEKLQELKKKLEAFGESSRLHMEQIVNHFKNIENDNSKNKSCLHLKVLYLKLKNKIIETLKTLLNF